MVAPQVLCPAPVAPGQPYRIDFGWNFSWDWNAQVCVELPIQGGSRFGDYRIDGIAPSEPGTYPIRVVWRDAFGCCREINCLLEVIQPVPPFTPPAEPPPPVCADASLNGELGIWGCPKIPDSLQGLVTMPSVVGGTTLTLSGGIAMPGGEPYWGGPGDQLFWSFDAVVNGQRVPAGNFLGGLWFGQFESGGWDRSSIELRTARVTQDVEIIVELRYVFGDDRCDPKVTECRFILSPDSDLDGITNYYETALGCTNPLNPDSDLDGWGDGDELFVYETNPCDLASAPAGVSPQYRDSDGDFISDFIESRGSELLGGPAGGRLSDPFRMDSDDDMIIDLVELWIGTDPTSFTAQTPALVERLARLDSDDDAIPDEMELALGTDPMVADEDGDGMSDGLLKLMVPEPSRYAFARWLLTGGGSGASTGTGPNDDTDGDGLDNSREEFLGSDPTNPDTDGDGIPDGAEVQLRTSPTSEDSDGDMLDDAYEFARGFDPRNSDQNRNGTIDGLDDFDGDGLVALVEQVFGLSDKRSTTDGVRSDTSLAVVNAPKASSLDEYIDTVLRDCRDRSVVPIHLPPLSTYLVPQLGRLRVESLQIQMCVAGHCLSRMVKSPVSHRPPYQFISTTGLQRAFEHTEASLGIYVAARVFKEHIRNKWINFSEQDDLFDAWWAYSFDTVEVPAGITGQLTIRIKTSGPDYYSSDGAYPFIRCLGTVSGQCRSLYSHRYGSLVEEREGRFPHRSLLLTSENGLEQIWMNTVTWNRAGDERPPAFPGQFLTMTQVALGIDPPSCCHTAWQPNFGTSGAYGPGVVQFAGSFSLGLDDDGVRTVGEVQVPAYSSTPAFRKRDLLAWLDKASDTFDPLGDEPPTENRISQAIREEVVGLVADGRSAIVLTPPDGSIDSVDSTNFLFQGKTSVQMCDGNYYTLPSLSPRFSLRVIKKASYPNIFPTGVPNTPPDLRLLPPLHAYESGDAIVLIAPDGMPIDDLNFWPLPPGVTEVPEELFGCRRAGLGYVNAKVEIVARKSVDLPGLNAAGGHVDSSWEIPVVLIRPPVLLVHGLHGSGDGHNLFDDTPEYFSPLVWDGMPQSTISSLQGKDRRVYIMDYGRTNIAGYDANYKLLALAIEGVLHETRAGGNGPIRDIAPPELPFDADYGSVVQILNGTSLDRYTNPPGRYAATAIDVIGHSMGGQLVRLYVSDVANDADVFVNRVFGSDTTMPARQSSFAGEDPNVKYLRVSNLWQGDVRRFVALGSPFQGAPGGAPAALLNSDRVLFKHYDPASGQPPFGLEELLETAWTIRDSVDREFSRSVWDMTRPTRATYESLADALRRRVCASIRPLREDFAFPQRITGYEVVLAPNRNAYEDLAAFTQPGTPPSASSIHDLMRVARYSRAPRTFGVATVTGNLNLLASVPSLFVPESHDFLGALEILLQGVSLNKMVDSHDGVQGVPGRAQTFMQFPFVTGFNGDGTVSLQSQLNIMQDSPAIRALAGSAVHEGFRHSRPPPELPRSLLIEDADRYNQLSDRVLAEYIYNVLDSYESGFVVRY
jgi:hypothetical protein